MSKVKDRKNHRLFLYIGLLSLLAGLLCISQPFVSPEPNYRGLDEKDVMVSLKEEWVFRGRIVTSEYLLVTMDGERYYISGKYDANELRETFVGNTPAHIRCFGSQIKELSTGDRIVVAYVDDRGINKIISLVVGIIITLLGSGFLLLYGFYVKNEARKAEMRCRRIEKKYGSH